MSGNLLTFLLLVREHEGTLFVSRFEFASGNTFGRVQVPRSLNFSILLFFDNNDSILNMISVPFFRILLSDLSNITHIAVSQCRTK